MIEHDDGQASFLLGDVRECLRELPAESVQCVVTSPPYWSLRDYGVEGQLGLEATPEEYIEKMVVVFREVRRVLRKDGTCWINIGDSYAANWSSMRSEGGAGFKDVSRERVKYPPPNLKPKDLVGIPWMLAFALRADGWYLRQDIIWAKPNPMPESVADRCTKAHEYLFLLTKSARYYYDAEAIKNPLQESTLERGYSPSYFRNDSPKMQEAPSDVRAKGDWRANAYIPRGANKRSVWTIATEAFSAARLGHGVTGGSDRITSPDCPVHGDQLNQSATAPHDGRSAASQSAHNPDSDAHPSLVLQAGVGAAATSNVESCAPKSSDSPALSCEDSASDHSRQTHRKGPSPETLQHGIVAGESGNRTGGTEPLSDFAATFDRGPVSKTGEGFDGDGKPTNPVVEIPSRNGRTCTCSHNTTDHFAVFPQALVEPCILAGTSERGCCAECGAPWARETAVDDPEGRLGASYHDHVDDLGRGQRGVPAASGAPVRRTTGWRPTCSHDAPTQPCVVMDPFLGSGTTALVARRLGRRSIGIDLSADYLDMAKRRCAQMGLFASA